MSWQVNIWKVKIWYLKNEKCFQNKIKTFFLSLKSCLLENKLAKQTSKNVTNITIKVVDANKNVFWYCRKNTMPLAFHVICRCVFISQYVSRHKWSMTNIQVLKQWKLLVLLKMTLWKLMHLCTKLLIVDCISSAQFYQLP